jgi:hypothetical protein
MGSLLQTAGPVKTKRLIHYSALQRITLCGLDIPFKNVVHTHDIHSVDCKSCMKRYEARKLLIKKHGVIE